MRSKERAFSLIELLIAMAIGMLLTLLVANLFAGSRNTNRVTDEVSRMQENIRFAYQLLTRSIRHAGYRTDPSQDPALLFVAPRIAITGTDGGGTAPDTISISFQGSGTARGAADAAVIDCLGTAFDQNVTITNMFYIANGANGGPALGVRAARTLPTRRNRSRRREHAGRLRRGHRCGEQGLRTQPVRARQPGDEPGQYSVGPHRAAFSTSNVVTGGGKSSVRTDLDTAQYDLAGATVGPFNDRKIRRAVVWNVNLRNRSPY